MAEIILTFGRSFEPRRTCWFYLEGRRGLPVAYDPRGQDSRDEEANSAGRIQGTFFGRDRDDGHNARTPTVPDSTCLGRWHRDRLRAGRWRHLDLDMNPLEFPAIYRLMVVRTDGTRQLIASGIPEDQAKTLREFLDAKVLASNLLIEPELRATDSSSHPTSFPNDPRRQSTAV
jgi:hypothetical protein